MLQRNEYINAATYCWPQNQQFDRAQGPAQKPTALLKDPRLKEIYSRLPEYKIRWEESSHLTCKEDMCCSLKISL